MELRGELESSKTTTVKAKCIWKTNTSYKSAFPPRLWSWLRQAEPGRGQSWWEAAVCRSTQSTSLVSSTAQKQNSLLRILGAVQKSIELPPQDKASILPRGLWRKLATASPAPLVGLPRHCRVGSIIRTRPLLSWCPATCQDYTLLLWVPAQWQKQALGGPQKTFTKQISEWGWPAQLVLPSATSLPPGESSWPCDWVALKYVCTFYDTLSSKGEFMPPSMSVRLSGLFLMKRTSASDPRVFWG